MRVLIVPYIPITLPQLEPPIPTRHSIKMTHRPCQIYISDILSFLRRRDINMLRQVSHYFNASIDNSPMKKKLPRQCLTRLLIDSGPSRQLSPLPLSFFQLACCQSLKVGLVLVNLVESIAIISISGLVLSQPTDRREDSTLQARRSQGGGGTR